MPNGENGGAWAIRRRFRERLARPGCVVAPGCHDALAARIAEREGFEAIYLSGNAASSGLLGCRDVGLATMSEMAQRARWVADCVNLPIIADADTGYGDLAAVARAVREFEAAGLAAIHIEDQRLPKRCGAMPGLTLVELDEATGRIRAALAARRDPNFLIVARTDAIATGDFDEAIRRGRAFAEAGANLVMVEDAASEEQVAEIPRRLPGVPLLFDCFETWPWTVKPTTELERMGYKVIIMCLSTTLAYARAAQEVLRAIRDQGSTRVLADRLMSRSDYEGVLAGGDRRE